MPNINIVFKLKPITLMKISYLSAVLLSLVLLVGCNNNEYPYFTPVTPNYFGFSTDEIVVDVTPDVRSFRIEGEFTDSAEPQPYVTIQREGTTVKHNVHFINEILEGHRYIGDFTIKDDKNIYKDVTIIPENITEEVRIIYFKEKDWQEPEGLIKKLTVILRPAQQSEYEK